MDFYFYLYSAGILILFLYIIFNAIYKIKVGRYIITDLGFIYSSYLFLFTIIPCINIIVGLKEADPIYLLYPTENELIDALLRQILYFTIFNLSYILLRGNRKIVFTGNDNNYRCVPTIIFLIGILIFSYSYLFLLSNPVENYYEAYIRYDNLPWVLKKIASLCIRFKMAAYALILTFLFLDYKRFKYLIPIFVISSGVYEIIFNYGARIQFFIIIVQAILLYSIIVKPISFKMLGSIGTFLIVGLTAVQIIRLMDFDSLGKFDDIPISNFISLPWEFNSVYYPNLHLYMERLSNNITNVSFPMFFNDFISLFTFGDFTEYNPMDWYHQQYHPDALVAPYTIGPIAESALWGGELDLIFRAMLNGFFFAFITRWFLKRQNKWWALVIYTFFCAISLLTLKYSVFFDLIILTKTLLPMLLLTYLFRLFIYKNYEKK